MKTPIYLSAIVSTVLSLSACITQETYMKAYKESTGIDPMKEGMGGRPCVHYTDDIKTNYQYQVARMKCAAEASGKPYITDKVISYSELKGGYELKCYFGGYDRSLIIDRLNKGVGLVQPVYIYGNDGAIAVDWGATEKLIALVKNNLKLNVRPISDTRVYDKMISSYVAPTKQAGDVLKEIGSLGIVSIGNKHYTEIISKLPAVDYVIAPSQDIVDSILSGEAVHVQESFKLASAAKNADESIKTTFKPSEIRQIQGVNALLEGMIRKNAGNVKLDFQLTERMKVYNDKDETFAQRVVQRNIIRGCEVADLKDQFVQTQAAKVEAAGADNKSFSQKFMDMVQVDSSNGLDISLSNEQGLRDQFISERKKLSELKAGYLRSMSERYQKINDQLIPFAAVAFQQFKITGFIQSKKL